MELDQISLSTDEFVNGETFEDDETSMSPGFDMQESDFADELTSLVEANIVLSQDLESVTSEKHSLSAKVSTLEEELRSLRDTLSSTQHQLKEATNASSEEELARLKSSNADLTSEIHQLKSQLRDRDLLVASLRSEIDHLHSSRDSSSTIDHSSRDASSLVEDLFSKLNVLKSRVAFSQTVFSEVEKTLLLTGNF
ncbi:hypothetical protein GEMRC1_011525 [Eukaryota sp. GEM-RC1]